MSNPSPDPQDPIRREMARLGYEEAVRSLTEQERTREQIRNRTLGLITVATAGTTFLAGNVLNVARESGLEIPAITFILLGAGFLGLTAWWAWDIIQPTPDWNSITRPSTFVRKYSDAEGLERLAGKADGWIDNNEAVLGYLQQLFRHVAAFTFLTLISWGAALVAAVAAEG